MAAVLIEINESMREAMKQNKTLDRREPTQCTTCDKRDDDDDEVEMSLDSTRKQRDERENDKKIRQILFLVLAMNVYVLKVRRIHAHRMLLIGHVRGFDWRRRVRR